MSKDLGADRPAAANGRPIVAIVDDDEGILRGLRIALSRYQVETFSNPVKGVVRLRTLKPDVVILDIKMPEHDGFWVFREVRKFNPTVPIIFNSAYQDIVTPEDLTGSYAPFGVLPKSGRLHDMVALIESALQSIHR